MNVKDRDSSNLGASQLYLQHFLVCGLKEHSWEKHGCRLHLELVSHLLAIDSVVQEACASVHMATNQQTRGHPLALLLMVTIAGLKVTRRHHVAVLARHTEEIHGECNVG